MAQGGVAASGRGVQPHLGVAGAAGWASAAQKLVDCGGDCRHMLCHGFLVREFLFGIAVPLG